VSSAAELELKGITKAFPGAGRHPGPPKPVLQGVSLEVASGRIVALLGPSGCGKTTLLRIVAGLEVPDAGSVLLGRRVLSDGASSLAPERRRIGMVFQDWALFPHLSVAANVGFGLPRPERKGPRVAEALALVGLDGLGERMPGTLSGGQQQRVALARALAPRPAALLLDEPFSNLDTSLRVRVRAEVHRLLTELGITTLFVTHDQEEAFVLGDEVAVLHDGVLVQQAAPADVYAHPADIWVAGFVGDANLVPGTVTGSNGTSVARTVLGPLALADGTTGKVVVLVRPEHVALERAERDGEGVVDTVEQYGHDAVVGVLLAADGEGAAVLKARLPGVTSLRAGDRVTARYTGGPTRAWPA